MPLRGETAAAAAPALVTGTAHAAQAAARARAQADAVATAAAASPAAASATVSTPARPAQPISAVPAALSASLTSRRCEHTRTTCEHVPLPHLHGGSKKHWTATVKRLAPLAAFHIRHVAAAARGGPETEQLEGQDKKHEEDGAADEEDVRMGGSASHMRTTRRTRRTHVVPLLLLRRLGQLPPPLALPPVSLTGLRFGRATVANGFNGVLTLAELSYAALHAEMLAKGFVPAGVPVESLCVYNRHTSIALTEHNVGLFALQASDGFDEYKWKRLELLATNEADLRS